MDADAIMQTVFDDLDAVLGHLEDIGGSYAAEPGTNPLYEQLSQVKKNLVKAQQHGDGRKSDDKLLVQDVFNGLDKLLKLAPVLGKKYRGDPATETLHDQLSQVKENLVKAQQHGDGRKSEDKLMQTVFDELGVLLTQAEVLCANYGGDRATETLHAQLSAVKSNLELAQLCRDASTGTKKTRKREDEDEDGAPARKKAKNFGADIGAHNKLEIAHNKLDTLIDLALHFAKKYPDDPATEMFHAQLSEVKSNLVEAQRCRDARTGTKKMRKRGKKLMKKAHKDLNSLLYQAEVIRASYGGDPVAYVLHSSLSTVKDYLELAQLCRDARTGTKKTRKREDEHEDGAPARKKAKNFGADISAEVMRKLEYEHDCICMKVTGQKLEMETDHDNVKEAMKDMVKTLDPSPQGVYALVSTWYTEICRNMVHWNPTDEGTTVISTSTDQQQAAVKDHLSDVPVDDVVHKAVMKLCNKRFPDRWGVEIKVLILMDFNRNTHKVVVYGEVQPEDESTENE